MTRKCLNGLGMLHDLLFLHKVDEDSTNFLKVDERS